LFIFVLFNQSLSEKMLTSAQFELGEEEKLTEFRNSFTTTREPKTVEAHALTKNFDGHFLFLLQE